MEYLNSIDIASLPPPHLEVKPGVPLMLLRNMDQRQGLCNGTRLRLVRMKIRVFVRIYFLSLLLPDYVISTGPRVKGCDWCSGSSSA